MIGIGSVVKFIPIHSQIGNDIAFRTGLVYDYVDDIENDKIPYYIIYTKRDDSLACCYSQLPIPKQPLVLPYNIIIQCIPSKNIIEII
jgi:hypothetical protein